MRLGDPASMSVLPCLHVQDRARCRSVFGIDGTYSVSGCGGTRMGVHYQNMHSEGALPTTWTNA